MEQRSQAARNNSSLQRLDHDRWSDLCLINIMNNNEDNKYEGGNRDDDVDDEDENDENT